ncbi:MAG: 50S ribosomal protein L29 [Candidatus Peregrinibacteria bacterium]|nr:50S ribosomal protein L29 [Candidatus Peregrinibacteria bacterium]MDZ4245422.1 50S ribosomal protein L29 [Candidatus Gracilibacteria bacterium]
MKTIAELKKMEKRDFDKELTQARKSAMKLRFEAKTGQLAGPHKLQQAKKYIAQMLTVKNAQKKTETN